MLSSCGAGGATYSKGAFVACLSREGAQRFGTSNLTAEQKTALARVLGSAHFVGARFAGGEEDGFIFASSTSAAKKIEGRLKAVSKPPLATAALLKSDANLVVLAPVHSTARVQKIISSCKANARLT
jgi:hypothetical protein